MAATPAPPPVIAPQGGPATPPGELALVRLSRAVNNERTQCWLLVGIMALTLFPLGFSLGSVLTMAFPMLALSLDQTVLPGPLQDLATGTGAFFTVGGYIVGAIGGFIFPAIAVLLANRAYQRQYSLAVRDLLYGRLALIMLDPEYARLIEEAAAQRYRPNPNKVDLGPDLLSHVNHFAHYYVQYYRLSFGPTELQIPLTIERNCWAEGSLAALGGCIVPCGGLGACLSLPLAYRICITWPRILATKQAVLNYFSGVFDAALEQMNQ